MARRKHNWVEIENRYVTGSETYRQIAELFKVSRKQIYENGNKFGWVKKRVQYREGLKAKLAEATQKSTVLEKARFDELAQHPCDVVISLMARNMVDAYEGKELSSKAAIETLTAIRLALDIKYRILGIPDKHEVKGSIATITELSGQAQAIIDKVMGTPETRSALIAELVPLKGGDVNAGGNGSRGNGSSGISGDKEGGS
jgi:hypothetical protein